MKLVLKRHAFRENYTIGKLSINDVYFCDTLEDKVRPLVDENNDGKWDNKVWGETAIPYGTYTVTHYYAGNFKRDMPFLVNVKGFQGIMIHYGNTALQTHGCILVGENKEVGKVLHSKDTFEKLWSLMQNSFNRMEPVIIVVC